MDIVQQQLLALNRKVEATNQAVEQLSQTIAAFLQDAHGLGSPEGQARTLGEVTRSPSRLPQGMRSPQSHTLEPNTARPLAVPESPVALAESLGQQPTSAKTRDRSDSPQELRHKDILEDDTHHSDSDLVLQNHYLAPDMQVQRLTAQLTAAYNRIAALEEQLLSQRTYNNTYHNTYHKKF